jgi:DNA-binding XRE family transcriptional regulator
MDLSEEEIEEVVAESQQLEEEIFLNNIREMYEDKLEEAGEMFEYTANRTDNFRNFEKEVIRENPNIVRILRNLVKPPISQMKFGQFVGVNSTRSYEKEDPTTPNNKIAQQMAEFVQENIDERKVPWLYDSSINEEEKIEISKNWVCDTIAQSEATTRYRNWRKEVQENKIEETLQGQGFEYQDIGRVDDVGDLDHRKYTDECKVSGEDVQKADFAVRTDSDTVMFIEAKAVGVRVDGYKRVKEIRNKCTDWRNEFGEGANVSAVIAGWIPADKAQTLIKTNITTFWEHRLDYLEDYLA